MSRELPQYASVVPNLLQLAEESDHLDVKTYTSEGRLDAFLVGFLNYMPGWIKALYGVRWVFVRLLGMRQEGLPAESLQITREKLPMTVGEYANVFQVAAAEPEGYWMGFATDKHLTAYICVIAEPTQSAARLFHVITLVQYHHWTGPVYFNVIRPFHHVVVHQMAQAGLAAAASIGH